MAFWDLLYKRYSNPEKLLQQMLDCGDCPDFIESFIEITNRENEERWLWEVWLHKDFENSFDDFLKKNKPQSTSQDIAPSSLEATVKKSLDVLEAFSTSFSM